MATKMNMTLDEIDTIMTQAKAAYAIPAYREQMDKEAQKMAAMMMKIEQSEQAFGTLINGSDADLELNGESLYLSTRCCMAGPVLATFTDAKCTKMAHPTLLTDTNKAMIAAAQVVYHSQIRSTGHQGCRDGDEGNSFVWVGGGCPVVMPKDETSDTGKQNCSAIKESVQQQKMEVRDDGWAATKIAVVYGSDCPSSQQ